MAEEYDYLFKSIVVGDGGVGKTALTLRFSKGFFTEDYKMTIGVDFHVKTITIDTEEGQIRAKLQIWDTGGQERFSSIRPMYYRGSLGALLIFDVTNAASFEHLPQWIEEVRANVKTEIPLLLVGNKSDLVDQRTVSLEEINNFTSNFNLHYMETSAKTGLGVGDCFYILACLMIGSGVPDLLISDGIVYNPGQIQITTAETSSPQLEPDYDAPPVPEPSPSESYESSHIFEPEPEFNYDAPPVPEPSPEEIYESTPTYEPEYEPEIPIPEPQIEEPAEQPAEFIFKTPEEILSNEIAEEERLNISVKPKLEEGYKPKAVPFTSNVPVPAPAPNGFQSPQEIEPIESTPTKTAPFIIPQDRAESQADVLKGLSHEPLYSKKSKKKIEKQKKKEEKEKKLQEEIQKKKEEKEKKLEVEKEKKLQEEKEKKLQEEKEKKLQEEKKKKLQEEKEKQEKLIEDMKKIKKEKKEKPKKVKKEKSEQIVSETKIPTQEISGVETPSPNSLFQTLSQKTEEPEKKSIASFVPFSEEKESEAPESSKLRIIPNVKDTESAPSSFTPIQSEPQKPAGNETTTCKNCGSVLSNDYVFCNKCGDRL